MKISLLSSYMYTHMIHIWSQNANRQTSLNKVGKVLHFLISWPVNLCSAVFVLWHWLSYTTLGFINNAMNCFQTQPKPWYQSCLWFVECGVSVAWCSLKPHAPSHSLSCLRQALRTITSICTRPHSTSNTHTQHFTLHDTFGFRY